MDNIAYKDGVLGVEVSPQSPMPVDQKGTASTINTISGETVQLFYSNAGVATIDADQDAGVAVSAKLAFTNIKTPMGSVEATAVNTSLSFTAGALTTEVDRLSVITSVKGMSFASQIAAITSGMTNGQYAVDYATGTIWGVKATTATTLVNATYKVQLSGGSSTPAITTPTAVPSTLSSSLPVAQYNTTAPTATNGQVVAKQCDVNGNDLVRETYAPRAEDNVNDVIAVVQKPLSEPTYSVALFTNYGANATLNVKATKGNVFAAYCKNKNASVRYLQLHNLSTTPATNAVPVLSFPVPASGGTLTLGPDFFLANGYHFNVGIAFAFSTDENTYQAGAAADQTTFIRYSA